MRKEEFYNIVVDIYKKTGQGLAGFVTLKTGREALDELVAEGKLKTYVNHYSYLPDDEWICLTGVYCAEEDMQNGEGRALTFIRRYLNIPNDSGIEKKIQEYLDANPKEKEKLDNDYNTWLNKNKELLEKSFQIEKLKFQMVNHHLTRTFLNILSIKVGIQTMNHYL